MKSEQLVKQQLEILYGEVRELEEKYDCAQKHEKNFWHSLIVYHTAQIQLAEWVLGIGDLK